MELRSGRASATVELEAGRLASLVVDGLEVLVTDGPKPTRWGSFPMIPWCGRLPFGRLEWEGAVHEFPLNSPPHANHGTTLHQQWTLENEAGGEVTIATPLARPWPFGGRAVQRFTLDDDALTVTATVEAGDRPMPAMIGWHPWFRRDLGRGEPAELTFAAEAVYLTDDDQIPDGSLGPVPPEPWDECFTRVTVPPVLSWAGAAADGADLRLAVESEQHDWVVFTQPDHAICIEPQTGPPNQIHLTPRLATPEEPLVATMTLRWG